MDNTEWNSFVHREGNAEKAKTACLNCGKLHLKDGEFFAHCSLCVQSGIVPAAYCSPQCQQSDWPRHSEWHQKMKKKMAIREPDLFLHFSQHDSDSRQRFRKLIEEGSSHGLPSEEAKKCFRKAQKILPKDPLPNFALATCFEKSHRISEALSYYQRALELAAEAVLKHHVNRVCASNQKDYAIEGIACDCAMHTFAKLVLCTMAIWYQPNTTKEIAAVAKKHRQAWITNDILLNKVSKLAMKTLRSKAEEGERSGKSARQMTRIRALFLLGFFSHGTTLTGGSHCREAWLSIGRSLKDGQEAVTLMKLVTGSADDVTAIEKKLIPLMRRDVPSLDDLPEIYYWVRISGLQGLPGDVLNNKLGFVVESEHVEERLSVKVDGIVGVKHILPKYLKVIPMGTAVTTVLSCLEESVQWKFVRSLVQSLHTKKQT